MEELIWSNEDLNKALSQFRANQYEDKIDLELCCEKCGETVCDIEHADTLDVLMRTALDHVCVMEHKPTMGIQSCTLVFDGFDGNGWKYYRCIVHDVVQIGYEGSCERAGEEE